MSVRYHSVEGAIRAAGAAFACAEDDLSYGSRPARRMRAQQPWVLKGALVILFLMV